jgi:hypothetical protein
MSHRGMTSRSRELVVASAAAALLAAAAGAGAHHSFSATYLEDREITVEGELVAFMLRNPHSFVHLEAPDEDGTMQRWSVEWAAASALAQRVARDTLRPGQHVVVTGNPGRDPAGFRLRMRRISRPADGWEWSGDFD